ncbi:hypothetical protein V9T40_000223 [Parthenolecanium corni]|uniref:Uncharacterized protein n=1 Tax=Parthenolecanium corni TaxID=536013 RepID=A0AAN9TCI3_9HEMI
MCVCFGDGDGDGDGDDDGDGDGDFALSHKQFVQLDEVPITSATILLQLVASSQATVVSIFVYMSHFSSRCPNFRLVVSFFVQMSQFSFRCLI